MNLSDFIRHNIEGILQEWQDHAFAIQPDSGSMDKGELRDHAETILLDIADGIDRKNNARFRNERARGLHPLLGKALGSAVEHGITRHEFGFTVNDVLSEYRALRASVMRLWAQSGHDDSAWDEIALFNEELDGVIKEAVAALAAATDRQRRLLEKLVTASRDHCYILNSDGRFIYVNTSLLDDLDLAGSDLLGTNLGDLQAPASEELHREAMEVIATGQERRGEITYSLPSGEGRIYEFVFEPLRDDQGRIEGVAAIEREITDRMRVEEVLRQKTAQLEATISSLPDGYIVYDVDRSITHMNEIAEEIFAYTHRERTLSYEERVDILQIQTETADPFPSEQTPTYRALMGETVRGVTMRIVRPHRHYWLLVSAAPIVDSNGSTLGVVMQFNDITERKEAENRLAAANRELEAFSYSVSHDLRAPLHVISSLSSSLRRHAGDRDSMTDEYLQRIEAAAKKMNHLISDILRLTKIGRHRIVREQVDLSGMARGFADELVQGNRERQVEIHIGDDLMAHGDPQLLHIAITNLLRNAWKYTSKKAEARIVVDSCERNGKKVFFISDNGVGFPMEEADRMFQPFQRLHSERDFPGTGVGLPLVRKVIDRHGGEIWAEGEVGKGAVFYFTLGS